MQTIMRTRIRIETRIDGVIRYMPQYRESLWWGWCNLNMYQTLDLENAKKDIDKFLEKRHYNKTQKVKSVKYMRYPWYPNGYN